MRAASHGDSMSGPGGPGDWLRPRRADIAAEQILDAAARLFVERGVTNTGMGDVARAAGCSRATLYRYFPNRQALRIAFVHREARRVAAAVAEQTRDIADPGERIVAVMLASLRMVRADPTLIAWFTAGDAGIANEIGQSSEVIEAIAAGLLPRTVDDDRARLARWLARIIMSLLTAPGRDETDERAMLEQFVVPVVIGGVTNS
ncbi:TetR/AcrR family transcriptional regulator [Nocardia sp. NBC_00565]|uniref:TetR/AcrR family transcriptional regulator n=1 Tax=Nocardia sp. NBC_00565 TaxID=2975993 RepID=UPI002E80C844|nr:helix-turn-helix domain-containing protein [Nocardia sp. NBC_00565]WUC02705.1 TetR/AcrR family transcriptional regulator [Nocardia sp. NBC_00565]